MDYQKAGIHFNGKSWCHNIKLLSDDGKIKYSKRAGFHPKKHCKVRFPMRNGLRRT